MVIGKLQERSFNFFARYTNIKWIFINGYNTNNSKLENFKLPISSF